MKEFLPNEFNIVHNAPICKGMLRSTLLYVMTPIETRVYSVAARNESGYSQGMYLLVCYILEIHSFLELAANNNVCT